MNKRDDWFVAGVKPELKTTRQYTYVGKLTTLKHKRIGVETQVFTANRRFINDRSKYMPHQGTQECARRAAR